MPIPVMIGASCASLALILYLIGILRKVITGKVLRSTVFIQLAAVVLDAAGTVAMMVQAGGIIPADFHGWIGYTALCLMVVDLGFDFFHLPEGKATTSMRIYAACALVFWIISYSLGFMKM